MARSRRGPASTEATAGDESRHDEGRQADVMKETLVATGERGPNGTQGSGFVPLMRGRHFALVGGHADRAAIRSKALADELAEIQFTDVGHARGARIAEV